MSFNSHGLSPSTLSGCLLCCLMLAGCAGSTDDSANYYATLEGHFAANRHTAGPVRRALLDEHENWVGTPYRLGGSDRYGIDCSALVQNIFNDSFQMSLPRTTTAQAKQGRPVKKGQLRAGDLVFFRPPGSYKHVGIYVENGYFLHASTSQGVKISRLDNRYWRRYYWQSRRPVARDQLAAMADR